MSYVVPPYQSAKTPFCAASMSELQILHQPHRDNSRKAAQHYAGDLQHPVKTCTTTPQQSFAASSLCGTHLCMAMHQVSLHSQVNWCTASRGARAQPPSRKRSRAAQTPGGSCWCKRPALNSAEDHVRCPSATAQSERPQAGSSAAHAAVHMGPCSATRASTLRLGFS